MKNKDTQLVTTGRDRAYTGKAVNPKIVRASTIVFDSLADMAESNSRRNESVETYGRRGTTTTFAFQQAMCELEGAAGCYVYPSGTSALTTALLAFLNPGDHLLMVDSVYEPTREFCLGTLKEKGVTTEFYHPTKVDDLASKIRPNTKVIFLESPGSLTMEVQDIRSIVELARQHQVITMIDNTYGTPYHFSPLAAGIDISIQSATKYICGHSDVMLGVSCANEETWARLHAISIQMGICASVDDVYTALRGLRTMGVRLKQHESSALEVARWLMQRPEVDHVRHPTLDPCPGSEWYQRDFSGANGLFSFVLNDANPRALSAMLDGYQHFKLGYSWGGYESLVLKAQGFGSREQCTLNANQTIVRLHIGLEATADLIDDLDTGFARYKQNC